MKGVTFGNYHSFSDFFLLLKSKEIEAAQPKVNEIEIEGADSSLDFTDYFGEVKFEKRELKFEFQTIVPVKEFMNLFSKIQNAVQGKKLKIILDDDPDFYYLGRVAFDKWRTDKNIGKITAICTCEPYKYRIRNTIIKKDVSESVVIACPNLKKSVVPIITTTDACQIEFNNNIYQLVDSGVYEVPEIEFKEGNNLLRVTGKTTITVEYQEGGL